MAKITLNDLTAGYGLASSYNTSLAALRTAIEKCLFRTGEEPNQMEALLDMNSFPIINMRAATESHEAVSLEVLETYLSEFGLQGTRVTRGASWVANEGQIDSETAQAVYCLIPAQTQVMSAAISTIGGPGSCSVDVRLVDRGSGPGTAGDSIVGDNALEITDDTDLYISDLTNWTVIIPEDKELVFILESSSTFTSIFVSLELHAVVVQASSAVHGNLLALTADDHPQYYNEARGDARYAQVDHEHTEVYQLACSDLTTALSTGTSVAYFRAPKAFTLTGVRASLLTAAATGTVTIDINKNGTTMLSTALTIDATEKTSATAATPAVISVSSVADDDEITVDIDAVGDTSAGLIVTLLGTPT